MYICTYIHIYIYAYMPMCIYAYMHICIYAYMHMYTYIHVYIYIYIYICTYISLYILYIHTRMHTYIHTYALCSQTPEAVLTKLRMIELCEAATGTVGSHRLKRLMQWVKALRLPEIAYPDVLLAPSRLPVNTKHPGMRHRLVLHGTPANIQKQAVHCDSRRGLSMSQPATRSGL